MPLHSKKDFASLCGEGFTTRDLAVYIRRGKVLMSGDFIDDQHPVNKEFLSNRQSKTPPKYEPPLPVLRSIRPDTGDQDSEDYDYQEDDEPGAGGESGYSLNNKKTQKQIEKLEVDTRLQELKEQKMRGELIPVDLVQSLFRAHTQSILTTQKDGIEELLINLSVEARLKGDQLAKLRGKMVKILNDGVEKSVVVTNRTMRSVRDEMKIKKGVGEHD